MTPSSISVPMLLIIIIIIIASSKHSVALISATNNIESKHAAVQASELQKGETVVTVRDQEDETKGWFQHKSEQDHNVALNHWSTFPCCIWASSSSRPSSIWVTLISTINNIENKHYGCAIIPVAKGREKHLLHEETRKTKPKDGSSTTLKHTSVHIH